MTRDRDPVEARAEELATELQIDVLYGYELPTRAQIEGAAAHKARAGELDESRAYRRAADLLELA